MAFSSFLDLVVPLFQHENWRRGLSLFHSGAVASFRVFQSFYICQVIAGDGEVYDVRIRFHPEGCLVQWMECSCKPNRKSAEKCPHIAAFCAFLNYEKANELKKLRFSFSGSAAQISSFSSDTFSVENKEKPQRKAIDEEKRSAFVSENKPVAFSAKKLSRLSLNFAKIISLQFDDRVPFLQGVLDLGNSKLLNYRFGIDDIFFFLSQGYLFPFLSEEMSRKFDHKITAKRVFEICGESDNCFFLKKKVILNKEDSFFAEISLADIELSHCGQSGFYLEQIGYIQFVDKMSESQILRWDNFPQSSFIKEEFFALLIENDFQQIREIAEVSFGIGQDNLRVIAGVKLDSVCLSESSAGSVSLQAKISFKTSEAEIFSFDLAQFLKARKEGKEYLRTEKGFVKIEKSFDWLQEKLQQDGQFVFSSLDFIRFHEEFLLPDVKIDGRSDIFERLQKGLIERSSLPVPSLSHTSLMLRPYQNEGVAWLWWLYSNSLGGILADEMGLGKTHQAMGLLGCLAEKEPCSLSLIVSPTTVIDHWLDKMQRFLPEIVTYSLYGNVTKRRQRFAMLSSRKSKHVVCLTSYGVLLQDIFFLQKFYWNVVILDEAHLVKNQGTKIHNAACLLRSQMRLCLTGTPLENSLIELKNLFDYILPGYLGSHAYFKKRHMRSESVRTNLFEDIEIHRLIHPFKLRRTKREVLPDLPEKTEDILYCLLNKDQKNLYNEVLSIRARSVIDDLQNLDKKVSYIHIFSIITLLKQICDDPALIDERYEGVGSGKLVVFDDLLQQIIKNGEKVVVFSQYAQMIRRLFLRLKKKGVPSLVLTGQSTQRGSLIKQFQEDEAIPVFLSSLLAGGSGIDLTAASVIIHFDRWWNGAKEDQATDRIHRIGQLNPVRVYKLVTRGSVEEKIDKIILQKRFLFQKFIDNDENAFKNFSREELLQLLKSPAEQ